MKRGELWTLQDQNYASKPRPAVIVQADCASGKKLVRAVVVFDNDKHTLGEWEIR